MRIDSPTMLMPGLFARVNSTGFVAVDLGLEADPIAFTPAIAAAEQARLPGWRYRREYLRDFGAQAGQPVFEQPWLDAQRPHGMNPLYCMDLDESGALVRRERGRLAVYLDPNSQPADGLGAGESCIRNCGIGMDVSEGVEASDSTIEVYFADNHEQAAEFADSNTTPSDLGRFAVAVAKFYNDALICCVRKMHGLTTLRVMADELHYANLWHHRVAEKVYETQAAKLGWARGESSDYLLFGRWIDAIDKHTAIVHSLPCLQQHGQYIYDERGKIVMQSLASLTDDLRLKHGDRVVGCALALRACMDLPRFKKIIEREKSGAEKYIEQQKQQRRGVWLTTANAR